MNLKRLGKSLLLGSPAFFFGIGIASLLGLQDLSKLAAGFIFLILWAWLMRIFEPGDFLLLLAFPLAPGILYFDQGILIGEAFIKPSWGAIFTFDAPWKLIVEADLPGQAILCLKGFILTGLAAFLAGREGWKAPCYMMISLAGCTVLSLISAGLAANSTTMLKPLLAAYAAASFLAPTLLIGWVTATTWNTASSLLTGLLGPGFEAAILTFTAAFLALLSYLAIIPYTLTGLTPKIEGFKLRLEKAEPGLTETSKAELNRRLKPLTKKFEQILRSRGFGRQPARLQAAQLAEQYFLKGGHCLNCGTPVTPEQFYKYGGCCNIKCLARYRAAIQEQQAETLLQSILAQPQTPRQPSKPQPRKTRLEAKPKPEKPKPETSQAGKCPECGGEIVSSRDFDHCRNCGFILRLKRRKPRIEV